MNLPPLTPTIEHGQDGWFIATCPELDVVTQGESPAHAKEMIQEAVELWLECAGPEEISGRLESLGAQNL